MGGASLAVRAGESRSFRLEGSQLVLDAAVAFETGEGTLRPESEAALSQVKDYLLAKTYISLLRIENHGDGDGDAAAAQRLSEKRALAVARALVGRGVDCKRLIAVGFGQSKPIADNATPEGKAKNRRTVFVNASLRGRPIGGLPADGGGKPAGDACH